MPKNTAPKRESTLLIEGANRAEATALLIRCGYRVYRPEVDFEGEDLVLRTPKGKLRVAQMKGVARVEWAKYGGRNIWMLFPSAKFVPNEPRLWYARRSKNDYASPLRTLGGLRAIPLGSGCGSAVP